MVIRKIFKIDFLKYAVAFLVPLIFVMLTNQVLDNDSWGVLAEGRYIVENGLYHTDVLSMHEGLNVSAVQNYGFAIIFWWIYSVFGTAGIYAGMLILDFVICVLLYKICMLLSSKNVNLSLLIMMITDIVLGLGFVVTRAQMISYVIFLSLIYVLELYIKTDKSKCLWWIPVLSLLQANLHASLWWMIIVILGLYIIDGIKKPRLHLQGYRLKPLIVVGLISFVLGFANPYGYEMHTLIFKCYGDSRFSGLVNELRHFSPFDSLLEAFVFLSMICVLFLYIFGNKKRIRIRYLLMFFGFLALSMNTVKGLSHFILVMFFPMALLYKNIRLEKVIDAKIGRDILKVWSGVVSACVFVGLSVVVVPQVDSGNDYLVDAVDAIDDDKGNESPESLRIYTGFNNGGYVEYRGYKPYLDPRGGDFLKSINGKEDILYEWLDYGVGKISVDDMIEKYDFDYILADEGEPLYELNDMRYRLIYEKEGCVRLYGK